MILQKLKKLDLIHPPKFLLTNCHYLTLMGSVAYGCSSDNSDNDVYGFCIPPLDIVFPHTNGVIFGFGNQGNRFDQWQEHHVVHGDKNYDFSVYNIVKYFQLCMENNPNMVDSLFTPINCVIHSTQIGNLVRENRELFLHKGCWPKFKGYSFSMCHKIKTKNPKEGSKRYENVQKYGFDLKYSYHVVRLLDEVEQILTTGTLDLQRNKEQLKAIRRGEWTEEDVLDYFTSKEKDLETVYANSKLPWGPREDEIKQLLLQCLEIHYGSLDKVIHNQSKYESAFESIKKIVNGLE